MAGPLRGIGMEDAMAEDRSIARAIVALFLALFVLSGCVSTGDLRPVPTDPFAGMHGQ